MHQVPVDGELVPYWQVGPAYAPWAGGFFGGGLLPGLFLGSMLGGAIGGLGVPMHAHDERLRRLRRGQFGGGGDL